MTLRTTPNTRRAMALYLMWYSFIASTVIVVLCIAWHKSRTRTTLTSPLMHPLIPATLSPWPQTVTIGILAPLPNEAAHTLLTGVSELLELSGRTTYKIIPYWGDGTRITLFHWAQQAARECNLLVTWGVTCANITHEAQELLANIPIIKVGLRSEQLYKLLPHSPKTLVVVTQYDYAQQVDIFKKLKPEARSICIAYRQHNDNMRNEVAQLNIALNAAGFKTDIQILAHSAHLDHQLSAFHQDYDTLFIMPHTITATNAQEVVTYCNNKKITLCAQEFDIVTLGGALGFGGHEKELGHEIAHIIRNIFEGKKEYETTTTLFHNPHYRCVINKNKCEKQGLNVALEYLTLLEQSHIFSTTPIHPLSEAHDATNTPSL